MSRIGNRALTADSRRETSASERPFVSVVLPVYRNPEGIARAIEALLQQSYPAAAYEVIVVDNGSDDGTREVVQRCTRRNPDRIRLVVENSIQSSYAARNRGLEAARGDVIAFTDSDCEPVSEWLEEGVRTLESADAAFAAGRVEITFRGAEPNPWEYYDAVSKLNQRHYVEDYGFGATANLFVRREQFERHGLFREDLKSSGDYEFGRRLSRAGERSVYAEAAVVRHPARATPGAILSKERRIALGQKHLATLGLLDHNRLSWRKLLPVRHCPPLGGTSPGPGRRLLFLLTATVVRYYTTVLRLLPTSSREPSGSTGE